MSGIGIPTYVVDSPHGGGKIPMMPNYLVSMSDDAVVLRNYEGLLIRYQAEDKPAVNGQPTNTRGVSGLLQGDKTVLIPENNERMARRKPRVVRDGCGAGSDASEAGPDGNTDGGALRPIIPLPMLNNNGNGHANGNGHGQAASNG
jgi:lysine 2,3-aminomutase